MHKNIVAVLGVLHPGISNYLKEYLLSLENQTFKEFDLMLFNDGFTKINSIKSDSLNIFIEEVRGNPSEIRLRMINSALAKGYKYLIFSDCDDFFSSNRLEVSVNQLENEKIVFNDLDLVTDEGKVIENNYLSKRLDKGQYIKDKDLINSNMMGLTNTAVERETLVEFLPKLSSEVIAFDWLLWTVLLNSKKNRAMYLSETSTKYRIYSNNIAGFPNKIDEDSLLNGLKIKLSHYKCLSKVGEVYESLYNSFAEAQQMSENRVWLEEYVLALNEHKEKKPLWWENIKTPKEVGIL